VSWDWELFNANNNKADCSIGGIEKLHRWVGMNGRPISHEPKWVDLEYRTNSNWSLRAQVLQNRSRILHRHGDGWGKHFYTIVANEFLLLWTKSVPERKDRGGGGEGTSEYWTRSQKDGLAVSKKCSSIGQNMPLSLGSWKFRASRRRSTWNLNTKKGCCVVHHWQVNLA